MRNHRPKVRTWHRASARNGRDVPHLENFARIEPCGRSVAHDFREIQRREGWRILYLLEFVTPDPFQPRKVLQNRTPSTFPSLERPLRIAFFGLPLAANLLLYDGHEIALAVLSRADAVGGRRLRRLLGPERVLLRTEATQLDLVERVRALSVDLVVSWFWTQRLPMALVEAAPLGAIGVHPSLLPRHRGADPYFAAIDAGDEETGVTAHRIAAEYDTGAILGQRKLRVNPEWNAWQLAKALDRPSLSLLRETVARYARGEAIPEAPQDESLATRADAPTDEDCALRWAWPTLRILRRIRALSPLPGAFTEIDGAMVVVTRARETSDFPRVLEPGEAAVVDDHAVVRTGDGAIALDEGTIDDEPADAAAFARLVARARAKVVG